MNMKNSQENITTEIMSRETIVNLLETMPIFEKTLITRKKRLAQDIEWIYSQMTGKGIDYSKEKVAKSEIYNCQMEECFDRIMEDNNEIKKIDESLRKIDLVRDAVYNLPPNDQTLITSYYFNKESTLYIANKLYFCRQTITRGLKRAIDRIYVFINCTKCTNCNLV